MQPRIAPADLRPPSVVVPLRPADAYANEAVEASGRLAPARGVMLGLLIGAALWGLIFMLAWAFFR